MAELSVIVSVCGKSHPQAGVVMRLGWSMDIASGLCTGMWRNTVPACDEKHLRKTELGTHPPMPAHAHGFDVSLPACGCCAR